MTPIYHITHFDNLPAIVTQDALLSDTLIRQSNAMPRNIAHVNIKQRRTTTVVPIPPGGRLCDYVPFYFCPRSPMLFAVHTGMVAGFPGGQNRVLHLVADAEALVADGADCVHTEGHAAMQPLIFHHGVTGLDRLDWAVIRDWSWRNTAEDNDRKRRKQAEFLIHARVPWSAITRIGAIDATIADEVRGLLAAAGHAPIVEVQPKWYYAP